MEALCSDLCSPFPKFQVGRVAFDGTIYYIFIFDTFHSPNRVSIFDRPLCILQPKPRNSTFVIESGGVLS